MDQIEIVRPLVCLVHNVSHGAEPSLLQANFVWRATAPLDVEINFISQVDGVDDVRWDIGVDFIEDALRSGQAGHPNVSPCLAAVDGEDFILTLRGFYPSGQISVSHATFDFEQVDLFVRQVHKLAGELSYTPEIERLIASLPE